MGTAGRQEGLTRRELLRRTAGAGAGLLLANAGLEPFAAGATEAVAPEVGTRRFISRPDLHPPMIDVLHPASTARTGSVSQGLLMLAPSSGPGQRGVMIIDDVGDLVWFHPTTPLTAMNLRATAYKGRPVLTWWEGKFKHGTGSGECVVVDDTYREVARFKAGNGLPVDLHEFMVTSEDTALVTSNEVRTMDLRSLGGPARHPVMGGVVLELEIPSGRVLREWHSLDHVALSESHQKIGPVFDYFHVNSIDVAADGNLLVSARNTWAVYKVNRETGAVMWRLGGKRSDFAMGKGTVFAWQHDARLHDGDRLLTVFDDGAAPKVEPRSRALEISLDTKRMRATLFRRYVHNPPLLAKYTGSAQLQPNGDMLVGWGSEPNFTEYAADGSVRFGARLPNGGQTYRVLRFPWRGRPRGAPAVMSRTVAGAPRLYASWNGATDVAAWELQTGGTAASLRTATRVPRSGFETALPVSLGVKHAAVVALDARGAALGRTAAIAL